MSDVNVRPNNRSASAMESLPRATYSDSEWAVRVELAALYQLCDLYGMTDLANGAIAVIQTQMYASDSYNYDGVTEWPDLIRKLDRERQGWQN